MIPRYRNSCFAKAVSEGPFLCGKAHDIDKTPYIPYIRQLLITKSKCYVCRDGRERLKTSLPVASCPARSSPGQSLNCCVAARNLEQNMGTQSIQSLTEKTTIIQQILETRYIFRHFLHRGTKIKRSRGQGRDYVSFTPVAGSSLDRRSSQATKRNSCQTHAQILLTIAKPLRRRCMFVVGRAHATKACG